MKYTIILLLIVIGLLGYMAFKPELKIYPDEDKGGLGQYYTDLSGKIVCDICHEETSWYKVDNRDRVICVDCYKSKFRDR